MRILVQYDDKAVTRVARVTLDRRVEPVVSEGLGGGSLDRPYTGGGVHRGAPTERLGVHEQRARRRRPTSSIARRGSRVRGGSRTLNDRRCSADKTLGAPVARLAVTSSFDRRPMDAWVVTHRRTSIEPEEVPARFVEIHGGPFASYGPLSARPTTSSTPRPATSCSTPTRAARPPTARSSRNFIHHDYPSHDYDDLMSAVDAAIAHGYRRCRQPVRDRRLGRRRAHRVDRRQDAIASAPRRRRSR